MRPKLSVKSSWATATIVNGTVYVSWGTKA